MYPYTIFPDREISGDGTISRSFRSLDIHRFIEACKFVHELPYGYNSNRDDLMILLKERFGSCTTKHATIATLAKELTLPISRGVGVYAMTEALVTGTGRILADYNIPYVPMIHCYLEFNGRKVDLTEGNRNGKNRIGQRLPVHPARGGEHIRQGGVPDLPSGPDRSRPVA